MNYLLLTDGDPLPAPLLTRLRKKRFVIAIDGAAEQARRERWLPNLISGDFDSLSPRTISYFRKKGVAFLHTPDQNHTDLEKALRWAIHQGATDLWVAQALGKRLDHSLANLGFLKRFHHPRRKMLLFTATETVRYLKDESIKLQGRAGRGVAVIPFPRCRATSRGLAFEMKATALALGTKESVSNRAEKSAILLKIKGEALVIEESK